MSNCICCSKETLFVFRFLYWWSMLFCSIHETLQQTLHGCQPSDTLFLVCPSFKFWGVMVILLSSVWDFFPNQPFLIVNNYILVWLKRGVNFFTMIRAYFEFQAIKHVFPLDFSCLWLLSVLSFLSYVVVCVAKECGFSAEVCRCMNIT